MTPLTIGQLANQVGVNLETVRYYERRGLLPKPPRSESGYRQYPPEAARRLAFIKRAQAVGFTLDEIAGLLSLRVDPTKGSEAVQRAAEQAIERIEGKLAELERMRSALRSLIEACVDRKRTDECAILETLELELGRIS